ncbi:hypothetical protein GCM10020254_27160 [Streptomyces goshikiensis]
MTARTVVPSRENSPPQFHDQPLPQPPVELPQRFVQHQQPRRRRQRPGQRHPLLLTARQRGHRPALGAGQPDQLQQLRDLGSVRSPSPAPHPEPEGDVPADVPVREQLVVLEHQAHAPPVDRHPGLVGAAQQHPAGRDRLEPGHHPQQRGLAASARSEDAHDLVLGDLQVHLVHDRAFPEADRDPLQPKQCHQNSPEVLSGRSRSSTSRDTAHTSIRIVLRAIACP